MSIKKIADIVSSVKKKLGVTSLVDAVGKAVVRNTEWKRDCGGKQDFDAPLISLSTRYYGDHTAYPQILLYLQGSNQGDYITLAHAEFAGETETEVKAKVEAWARIMIANLTRAAMAEFVSDPDKAWKTLDSIVKS